MSLGFLPSGVAGVPSRELNGSLRADPCWMGGLTGVQEVSEGALPRPKSSELPDLAE